MRAIANEQGILVCDFEDRRDMDATLACIERQHAQ